MMAKVGKAIFEEEMPYFNVNWHGDSLDVRRRRKKGWAILGFIVDSDCFIPLKRDSQ